MAQETGKGLRLVVIGAGPGGYAAAALAAAKGCDTTLVEAGALGGTCLNTGCIPSKILRKSTGLFREVRESDTFGISTREPELDMAGVQARKKGIIAAQQKGVAGLMEKNGVKLIQGRAALEGRDRIRVDQPGREGLTLEFDRLILATGSVPAQIPGFPFDGEHILSSDHVLDLETLPESVLIVGGGVIGCEFAFILNDAGVKVTVVEALDRVLDIPGFDGQGSKLIQRAMKKRKIKCLTSQKVTGAVLSDRGCRVSLEPTNGQAKSPAEIEAEKVIVVAGRQPATKGLGLETAGVDMDGRGYAVVNEFMETSVKNIYAIGDMAGFPKPMLAHVATAEARRAVSHALGSPGPMSYRAIPSAVFTSPEAAWVGITAKEAEQAGISAQTHTLLFRTIGKVQVLGELDGEAAITADTQSGIILGVRLVGAHATELISQACLAVENKLTLDQLANTIHAHPTVSEVMVELAWKATGQALHA
ncbi:MAG: dihydrolipoyl dehydrogenase [Desulfobacterales bacterium]|nr:dihydrolipoyl dehydrogenase [Desulfobacterales bacterium]